MSDHLHHYTIIMFVVMVIDDYGRLLSHSLFIPVHHAKASKSIPPSSSVLCPSTRIPGRFVCLLLSVFYLRSFLFAVRLYQSVPEKQPHLYFHLVLSAVRLVHVTLVKLLILFLYTVPSTLSSLTILIGDTIIISSGLSVYIGGAAISLRLASPRTR